MDAREREARKPKTEREWKRARSQELGAGPCCDALIEDDACIL